MSESKPCGCNIVFDGEAWSILYCPLHAAAPTNAVLAGIGRELARAVLVLDADTCCRPKVSKWQEIVLLARRVVGAAQAKEPIT